MFFHGVPSIVQRFYSKRTWRKEDSNGKVFLTFDDGPVPGVTDFALSQLTKRGMKATFFMVGENVKNFPNLAREVISGGNQLGNHTAHHLNGWKTKTNKYLNDFQGCELIFENVLQRSSKLFRPPYGMITGNQAEKISESHQIIMWNVLSGDYDSEVSIQEILNNTQKRSKSGSIIVFHDQQKTNTILPKFLPQYLDFLIDQGFETDLL
jgi:peptidoglycan/xylan/chitin deacetylase (PgdA/CDA1 family)